MSETNDSQMNDSLDDSRLTAYALGELEGDDLREIEALLASNEAARRAVDEIRATASLVTAELGAAGGEALTAEQRAKIAARAAAPAPVVPMRRLYWTAAAALIVGATAGAATSRLWMAPRTAERDVAKSKDDIRARVENHYDAAIDEPASDPAKTPGNTTYRIAGNNGSNGLGTTVTYGQGGQIATERGEGDHSKLVGGAGGSNGASPSTVYSAGGGGGGGGSRFVPAPTAKPAEVKPGVTTLPNSPVRHARAGGVGNDVNIVPVANAALPRPAAPPAPPIGGGPGTPGGSGPATGGPVADPAAKQKESADFHKLTWEQKRLQDELFASEVQFPGGTAQYAHIEDNPFRLVKDTPLSTFGADVDTASYSNVRRFLNSGQLPPPGAVRIEEMVNYFPYDYAPPTDGRPFAVRVDVAGCPWKTDHRLVRIGIKGKIVESAARPAANLVFLLDVSGSMQPAERLPLVLQSMKLLVEKLEPRDRVAIVVYAGESGLALPSTSCEDKAKILAALDALHAGGSTNGAAGIQLAYDIAVQNRIEGGVNRVILATDGDFNVGVSDESSLVKLIEEKRKTGVFLSVLGVGTDNFKDAQMEKLADKGNGAFAYVDTLKEGQKVLVEQASGTLYTIAKDVKFQVEFNPAQVGSWRLIGYENRVLAAEDFKDDAKDAGEIGAGHTVTALYELIPPGVLTQTAGVEPLKYQQPPAPTGALSNELLTVKLRWKAPDSDVSTPMEVPVIDEGLGYSAASPDFKFAASVAAFGMCLRGSPNKGQANLMAVVELATEGAANDPGGYRHEFVDLVKRAVELGAK